MFCHRTYLTYTVWQILRELKVLPGSITGGYNHAIIFYNINVETHDFLWGLIVERFPVTLSTVIFIEIPRPVS